MTWSVGALVMKRFQGVSEGVMTNVVKQARHQDASHINLIEGDSNLRPLQETLKIANSGPIDPDRVLKPRVRCAWVDEVRRAELPDPP